LGNSFKKGKKTSEYPTPSPVGEGWDGGVKNKKYQFNQKIKK